MEFLNQLIVLVILVLAGVLIWRFFLCNKQTGPKRSSRRSPGRTSSFTEHIQGEGGEWDKKGRRFGDRSNVETTIMSFWQLEVYGPRGIRRVPLTDSPDGFYIGRSDECDLKIIDSDFVGREHAVIYRDAHGDYVLKDLNTVNGTFSEDGKQRIEEITLTDGLALQLADVKLRCVAVNPFLKHSGRDEGGQHTKAYRPECGSK